MTSFSLYLQNEGVSRHETLRWFSFLFPLQLMKRAASPNKRVGVLRMAFRARKKFGTLVKRIAALGSKVNKETYDVLFHSAENSQRFFYSKGKRSRKTSEIIPFYLKKFKGGGENCSINNQVFWSKPSRAHPGYEAWLSEKTRLLKRKWRKNRELQRIDQRKFRCTMSIFKLFRFA